MAFDLSTAKPVEQEQPAGFDLATARSASEIPGPRRTWAQTASEAVRNIPGSAQKFASNLYQAVTSPVETAKGLGMAAAGGIAKVEQAVLPESVTAFVRSLSARPELYDQAVRTADAVGGFYKERYGSVDQLKQTLATDPVGAAADLSTLLSGGAMAVGGVAPKTAGVLNAASKITDPITTGAVKVAGAGMRGAATVTGNVIDAARGERPAVRAGEIVRQAVTDQGRRPSNVAVLRGDLRQAAPGLTGAEAAAGVEAPQLQAMADIVSQQRAPGVAGVVQQAQEAGRRNLLQSVTPDLQAAESARTAAAGPLYDVARTQGVPLTPSLESIINRVPPKVLRQAAQLAKMEGQPFVMPSSGIIGPGGAPAPAQISGNTLHYIKLGIDDALGGVGDKAISDTMRRSLAGLKTQFLSEVENAIPAYGQARKEFARLSPPVDQARVLTEMQNVLAQPLGVGERGSAFMNVLGRGEGAMLKRSTGFPRYESLADVLTPQQMEAVQSVSGELKRGASMADQVTRGRQALDQIIQANTYGFRLPGLFSAKIQLANDTLALLQGRLNVKVFDELEKGFQSAQSLDALIGKVPAKDRVEVLRALGEASEKLSTAKPRLGAQFQATQQNEMLGAENRNNLAP
jgi:hypothetical protein